LEGLGHTSRAVLDRMVSILILYCRECVWSYVRAAAAITRVEAVDVTSDVAECEISELYAGVVGSLGGSCASLVDVCLLELATISSNPSLRRLRTCVMKKGNVTL
jgi:hypothetical protein